MNDLIKIEKTTFNGTEINSVNARELYDTLGLSKGQYSRWINSNLLTQFLENEDFIGVRHYVEGNEVVSHIVTIDTAKHLCMMAKTENAMKVRKYFIETEKKANKPISIEDLLKANVKMISDLQNKVITLENKVQEDKPKVAFANAITGTTSNIDFETFAKALFDTEGIKLGRNKLMSWFRENKYLTPKNKPYQVMLDRGLMTLKEGSYVNSSTGELVTYTQSRITGKGQLYFTNKLVEELSK